MRYLVTCDRFVKDAPGGAYRIAWELAILAHEAGHEVAMLCGTPDPQKAGLEERDGVLIARYPFPRLSALDPRRWSAHVSAAATAVEKHLGRAWDVVHVHTLVGGAAAAKAGIEGRYVYTVHSPAVLEQQVNWRDGTVSGFVKRLIGTRLLKREEAALLARASTVHVLSEYTREELGRIYGNTVATRAVVVPWWQAP